ncbi:NAD-dependent epimerase/dehydratase family protein [uncultured Tessaracoccus sp.]|uniref:NAD-dependent epimerase/dehydratase family protein n=1 Tax=uncultured Tessaracoccus sp. TaxID=905023 RepID=UPI0025D2E4F4|nr:NAD-dependent epimerase/dehydratase family protein [uncultured Tessaracoccus sp.]
MDVLVLGGTAFLGSALARHLLSHDHAVTCLARGSRPVPAGANLVRADRDQPGALAPVAHRDWDVIIDLTSQPMHASRAAAELTTRHWIVVSSGSVYADFSVPEQPATSPTVAPLDEERMEDMSQYGAAKVACERAYLGLNQPVTVIRPGLIGGAGDWTGRSGYYPWRFAHPTGADVLVPDPTQPTAILDVQDLAAWIVHCAHETVTGVFNAAGATTTLAEVYQLSQSLTGSPASIRVIDDQRLLEEGIRPWMGPRSLPLWIPVPGMRHMATLDCGPARANGLRTRSLAETLEAVLRYEERRDVPRQAGLTDAEEAALRAVL